jgi:hypothetical protein
MGIAASRVPIEIAPELTGRGLPLSKCEGYNRVYDQFYRSRSSYVILRLRPGELGLNNGGLSNPTANRLGGA